MVRGSPDAERIGDRVAPGPGVREDDRLAPEALGRGPLVLLGRHLLDHRDLLLALGKEQVALQPHRAVSVHHERAVQFLCQDLGRADRCREVQELGLRGEILEPGDHPVEPVAPVSVLQHLDLIDDHGCRCSPSSGRSGSCCPPLRRSR